MDLLQSHRLIVRSIASTDVDGRKTRIATYTFCKNKTETDSEHITISIILEQPRSYCYFVVNQRSFCFHLATNVALFRQTQCRYYC